ncbi:hypothetical protein Tco_0392427 [Tanacetum coccineum]
MYLAILWEWSHIWLLIVNEKALIISNPEQCNQTINELPQTLPSVHPTCNYEDENSFTYDSKPNSFNDSPSVLTHPPQLQFETYLCELCGNNAHYGYDCPPQFPLVYEQEPCYNQNFNDNYFPQNSQSSSQQYLCCKNCRGPHETFQCQPMNEDYYEQNSCYYPNSFGFDQYQPPQFPVNYPSQETSREILQIRNLRKLYNFLKEYDHIPPNEKCMALLLAEERSLKIKQVMREEQNQPEVMQELLLKLMDDLQILKGSQQEKKETATQSFIPYWNSSMIDNEEARDNFLKDVYTFLRSLGRIHFLEYTKGWNRPLFYFDDNDDEYTVIWRRPKAITSDEPSREPEDPLIMGKRNLALFLKRINLVLRTSSKSQVDPRVEFTGEFVPIPPGMDKDEFDEKEDDCYNTTSDDDSYENIKYVEASPLNLEYDCLEEENKDQEEKEFDLEDIFQIQDVILREKLLNINRLISNIESLKNNPTPDRVLESPSPFPIPVADSDSFLEKSDTPFSHSDNSLPEFETFSHHTEETRSGSTTTHANNSLPEYDSFLFEIEPDQGRLIIKVALNIDKTQNPSSLISATAPVQSSYPRT